MFTQVFVEMQSIISLHSTFSLLFYVSLSLDIKPCLDYLITFQHEVIDYQLFTTTIISEKKFSRKNTFCLLSLSAVLKIAQECHLFSL